MKIRIVCVSHKSPDWARELAGEYVKRLPCHYLVEIIEIKPAIQDGKDKRLQQEADLIRHKIPTNSAVIALDEGGVSFSSIEFCKNFQQWLDFSSITFVIGSADGLDCTIKELALVKLSLSKLTLPHSIARILLVEQIYRAYTISIGHPYHRN